MPSSYTSPSYTASYRIFLDETVTDFATVVKAVSDAGASIKGMDVVSQEDTRVKIDITCDTTDSAHRRRISDVLTGLAGVQLLTVADQTFLLHIDGKIEMKPRFPVRNRDDLSRIYTPGVARVCQAIADEPRKAYGLTMKANSVAVLSDGTAVLGMGDIGPTAALPVMEGKAVLFKQFGDVDAWPVVVDTKATEEIIKIAKAISPAYGGINLEDISAPRCFEIERRLRAELDIPVFHDDQHGTAVVTLAALKNALKVVGKRIEDVRIVCSGVGAAGSAIIKLLQAQGARDIVGYGRTGALNAAEVTPDMNPDRRWLAEHTNPRGVSGSLRDGIKGADVFIGVSHGNILEPEDLRDMNEDAIVFAMANPTPEVDPVGAAKYAKVVATGRSDFPNQINNVLAFPGIFRGILDAKVTEITTELLRVAAVAIAESIDPDKLRPTYIIPGVFDKSVPHAVAKAVREAAKDLPRIEMVPQESADPSQRGQKPGRIWPDESQISQH